MSDLIHLYIGPQANSGWNTQNTNIFVQDLDSTQANYGVGTVSVSLVGGTYNPYRILFAHESDEARFGVVVTRPDFSVIAGSLDTQDALFVQYSCDDLTAPSYPPFGSET